MLFSQGKYFKNVVKRKGMHFFAGENNLENSFVMILQTTLITTSLKECAIKLDNPKVVPPIYFFSHEYNKHH